MTNQIQSISVPDLRLVSKISPRKLNPLSVTKEKLFGIPASPTASLAACWIPLAPKLNLVLPPLPTSPRDYQKLSSGMLRKFSLVIVLLNLLLLWVDVFTFSGFLQLHLGIPMKIILTFSVVISTLIYLIPQPTHKFSHKLVIPTIILILLYLLIVTIEGITSPGYIFSN